tara:strand:- start:87 stop:320 length:234 start_codon:yes stop_codon:yes gene_type:complete
MTSDFGLSVQDLTLKATLLGKIATWNELAHWLADNRHKFDGTFIDSSRLKSDLIDLIMEKTDELNAEFETLTSEDSE